MWETLRRSWVWFLRSEYASLSGRRYLRLRMAKAVHIVCVDATIMESSHAVAVVRLG